MIGRLGVVAHWLGFLMALSVLCLTALHIMPALGPDQCAGNGWEYAWLDGGLCARLIDRVPPYVAATLAAIACGVAARYVLTGRLVWLPWSR